MWNDRCSLQDTGLVLRQAGLPAIWLTTPDESSEGVDWNHRLFRDPGMAEAELEGWAQQYMKGLLLFTTNGHQILSFPQNAFLYIYR